MMKNVTSTTAWLAGTIGVVAIIWACSFSSGLMAQSDDTNASSDTPFGEREDFTEQDSEEDTFLESEMDELAEERISEQLPNPRRRSQLRGEWQDQDDNDGEGDEWGEEEDDGEFEAEEWNEDFDEADDAEGEFEEAGLEEGDEDWDDEEWQLEGGFDRDSLEEEQDWGEEDFRDEEHFEMEGDRAPGEMAGLLHQVASDENFSAAYALERLATSLAPDEALEILEQLRSETRDPARLRMIQVAMMAIYGETEQKGQAVEIARGLFLGN
ncbi:MAG: hypothetical protein AAF394_01155 [Planctomycetota bacterium]